MRKTKGGISLRLPAIVENRRCKSELPTGHLFSAWPGLALLSLPAGQAKNKRVACRRLQAKPGQPMFLIFQIYKN